MADDVSEPPAPAGAPGGASAGPERLDRRSLFHLVCRETFRDGEIDEAENKLLNRLRKFLRLDRETARQLGKLARHEWKLGNLPPGGTLQPRELYRKVCERAWADAVLDENEKKLLSGLARLLKLSDQEAGDLLARAEQWAGALRKDPDEVLAAEPGEEGLSSREIARERLQAIKDSVSVLDWKLVEKAPPPPPPPLKERLGGWRGITMLVWVWLSMVVLTWLSMVPARGLRGAVAGREYDRDRGMLAFTVEGVRFETREPGLIRWVRIGDRVQIRYRNLPGSGTPWIDSIVQLREGRKGYRYDDYGPDLARAAGALGVVFGLMGFALATRRRPTPPPVPGPVG